MPSFYSCVCFVLLGLIFVGCVFACIGRALEWHSRGQRFEPHRLHHENSVHNRVRSFIMYSFIETLIYLCYNIYSNTSDGYTDNVYKY